MSFLLLHRVSLAALANTDRASGGMVRSSAQREKAELKRIGDDPPHRPTWKEPVMKRLMIPLTLALLASQPVFAAECTTDQINEKAKQLADRVNQLTESNPERAAEINEELRDMEVKQTADQLGNECEAYDKRLQHVEQAEKDADIAPAEKR